MAVRSVTANLVIVTSDTKNSCLHFKYSWCISRAEQQQERGHTNVNTGTGQNNRHQHTTTGWWRVGWVVKSPKQRRLDKWKGWQLLLSPVSGATEWPGSSIAVVIFKYIMNIQPQLAAASQPMVDQFKLSNFNLWRCMQRKEVTSCHLVSHIPSF